VPTSGSKAPDRHIVAEMVTADDVLWIVGLLERAGVRFWVDGGWGVDALLGRQTRDHDDLDIALEYRSLENLPTALEQHGLRHAYSDGPLNPVFADGQDRRIDVHLVDASVEIRDEHGGLVYGPAGLPYPVGSFEAEGSILGRPVPRCTAEFQVWSHSGYEIDDNDIHDVVALHRRFGVPLPPAYQGLEEPGSSR
jgi:lincosamide nucleotidyltransferase A/C/D/E